CQDPILARPSSVPSGSTLAGAFPLSLERDASHEPVTSVQLHRAQTWHCAKTRRAGRLRASAIPCGVLERGLHETERVELRNDAIGPLQYRFAEPTSALPARFNVEVARYEGLPQRATRPVRGGAALGHRNALAALGGRSTRRSATRRSSQ